METEEIILITVLERVVNLTPKSTTRKPSGAAPENWTDIAFSDRPYTAKRLEFDASLESTSSSNRENAEAGATLLAQVAEPLVKKGIKAGITVLMGEAAEQIVDFASDENADLIIMASHGGRVSAGGRWGAAEKVFHGSSVRFYW